MVWCLLSPKIPGELTWWCRSDVWRQEVLMVVVYFPSGVLNCYGFTHAGHRNRVQLSDPAESAKSEWRLPISVLLVLRLQLKLAASGEGPLPQFTPLNYVCITHHPISKSNPKSNHLILAGGLLISGFHRCWAGRLLKFLHSVGIVSLVLLHSTCICQIQLALCQQH